MKTFSIKEYILVIFILGIFTCSNHNLFAQIENDSIIYWSKNRPLSNQDFQGKIPEEKHLTNEIANICAGVSISGSQKYSIPEIKVFVIFYKKISWKKSNLTLSILQHEQTHFDISELYGRKIREIIQKLNNQEEENIEIYKTEISKLQKEKESINKNYDYETRNGRDESKQKEWNEKITKELEIMKEFEVDYSEYLY